MVDRPANQAPEELTAVYGFYGRKNNTTNNFVQYPENEVAHAIGLSGSDKGKMFYVDSNGKIAKLSPGGDEDVLGFLDGVPRTVPGAAAGLELTKAFVATGSIADGSFVALRSDGTVEQVTGSETLASTGSDVTVSAVTSMRLLSGAYNDTSGKVVILYYDDSAGTYTIYAAIGTVSGTTIAFGTPQTFTGGTGSGGTGRWDQGKVVWNAAGNTIVIAFAGTSGAMSFVCGTVSGTVITYGSVAAHAVPTAFNNPGYIFFKHDDTHGSRVILFVAETEIALAATYSGTTLTVGAQAAVSVTDSPDYAFYDPVNARLVVVAVVSTGLYLKCATVSGTTWTVGSEVNNTTTLLSAAVGYEYSSGKIAIAGLDNGTAGNLYTAVATVSGTTITINSPVKRTQYDVQAFAPRPTVLVAEPTSVKMLLLASPSDGGTDTGLAVFVGTISGTSMTLSDYTPIVGSNGDISSNLGRDGLFVRGTNSEVVVKYQDTQDFNRVHIAYGKVVSGAFVLIDDYLMRSTARHAPTTGVGTDIDGCIQAAWSFIDLGNWGTSGASATATVFRSLLPIVSTNADDWIGVARDAATNGNSVSVRLRGGIAEEVTGLTSETDYYLKGDGTLTSTDNGRYVGRALSATVMLMEGL